MSGLLTDMGPEGTALALLVLGHVTADFALQSRWMLANKDRPAGLAAHGAVVFAVHAVAMLPMLTGRVLGLLVAVAVVHALVDGVKARLQAGAETSLGVFLGDQVLHLLVLLAAWSSLSPAAWEASWLIAAADGVPYQVWTWTTTGAVYVSGVVFLHHGGNAIVQGVLPAEGPGVAETGLDGAGRVIGTLERLLVLGLALAARWEAVALVIGAKSIARFEELKSRPFAEYFLVGTLASVLVAVLVALLVQTLV